MRIDTTRWRRHSLPQSSLWTITMRCRPWRTGSRGGRGATARLHRGVDAGPTCRQDYNGSRIFLKKGAQRASRSRLFRCGSAFNQMRPVSRPRVGPLQPLKRPVGLPAERVHTGNLEGRRCLVLHGQFGQSGVCFLLSPQRVIRERLPVQTPIGLRLAIHFGQGLFRTRLGEVEPTEEGPCAWVGRVEFQRLREACSGLLQPTRIQSGNAKKKLSLRTERVQFHRPAVQRQGLVKASQGERADPQHEGQPLRFPVPAPAPA